MTKLFSAVILMFWALTSTAQQDFDNYIKTHHFAFTLDKGFDQRTSDVLRQKLNGYKLVLLGEGGSHYLQFYEPLRFVWTKFLSSNFGLTNFFMEFGHSSDILCNQFLETGDTNYLPKARFTKNKIFWNNLYHYNSTLLADKRVKSFGIDFERTHSYAKALKFILPNKKSSDKINTAIELIAKSNDTITDCGYVQSLNSRIKDILSKNKEDFKNYFNAKYSDFTKIIENNGSCSDAFKNRNKNMAANFLSYDNTFNDKIYYGQLGMAHTVLINKNTAYYINTSQNFKDKVCVINTYCYNCTTTEEDVSNWQLHKIEKDILQKLLQYCTSDFTLFDFSDINEATDKFRKYGQFLIIAKNQN